MPPSLRITEALYRFSARQPFPTDPPTLWPLPTNNLPSIRVIRVIRGQQLGSDFDG
ncbi:MAG: hypothetical protein JNN07_07660 [Verrucomicrobiales bacterium]|nr:hypothetical protein [Verrucomicrobiales bacterium]